MAQTDAGVKSKKKSSTKNSTKNKNRIGSGGRSSKATDRRTDKTTVKPRTSSAADKSAVSSLRRQVERKLKTEDAKATYADYIRLLQLEKEMDEEQPREIKVEWVERSEETSVFDE